MTTLIRIAIAFLVALFLSSCGFDINIGDFGTGEKGNGTVVTDTREVTDQFTEVSASEGLSVYVTQSNEFNIKVEADENIIDLIATDIKNGKLRIHATKNIGNATKKIFVSLPVISDLSASSGSQLKVENTIESDYLELDGSSGAQIYAEVVANAIEIDASSGAHLTISGKTNRADVGASSGGNINAKNLSTKTCTADASSGGNVKIEVSETLVADASSGGHVAYSGAAEVQTKKSVSGKVYKY
ncbi:head GIN domain-containing protein [Zobellia alginiliquefaciens]|uniref:head GIN domain-containing protein n=1 Tax=Zobellia alginiliquefaciens TaxID=3032586 RepID=UPI0023E3B123|nr:head GIN domain-containing protein [Zobellia alginiliquefaciens]